MDVRRIQEIKRNFQDKLSSELAAIRDVPGDSWSEAAVVAASELLDERTVSGTLEAENARITTARASAEIELAEAVELHARSTTAKHIDTIATLYILTGGLGILLFGYIAIVTIPHISSANLFASVVLKFFLKMFFRELCLQLALASAFAKVGHEGLP